MSGALKQRAGCRPDPRCRARDDITTTRRGHSPLSPAGLMSIMGLVSLNEPAPREATRKDAEPAGAGRMDPARLREARRRAKISQIVAAEIVRYVVDERLEEGDRLPTEAEMLEEFGVGRGSPREALRLLEAYGLISIRQGQNGGPVVATLRPQDLSRTLSFYFHLTGATYAE